MGTKKLLDFEQQLGFILQDDAGVLPEAQVRRALQQAIEDYSRDRPQKKKFDFQGDGTAFDIPVPAGWVVDFSRVLSIEHPADEREPVYLDAEDWVIYRKADGSEVIRLLDITPLASDKARVEWTSPHSEPQTATVSTIPDPDFFAVCDLAAHYAFLSLAAELTQTIDPTSGADSIDRQAAAERYRILAGSAKKRYDRRLGKDQEESPAAGSAVRDLEREAQFGSHLTHPERER